MGLTKVNFNEIDTTDNHIATVGFTVPVNVIHRLSASYFYGRVPLGTVISVIGVFQSENNGGTFTTGNIPSSGTISNDGFQLCDGSIINNSDSIFNGKYTPKITDDRFIQGSTSAGQLGGASNNEITISQTNLPTHSHDINHTHSATTGSNSANHAHSGSTGGGGSHGHFYNPYGGTLSFNQGGGGNFRVAYSTDGDGAVTYTNSVGDHTHSFSTGTQDTNHVHSLTTSGISTSTSGDGSGTFNSTPINIRPKYITAIYLIRVL